MASFPLMVTRAVLGTLSKSHPTFAGRLAFRLFSLTPGRKPKSDKEKAAIAAAAPIMAKAVSVTLSYAGGWVLARDFPVAGATRRALVVHGWGSRSEYMATLIDRLVREGTEVVALDWPGHGGSPGRVLTMPAAVRSIDAAWRHFGGFDTCIGHSFGGASLVCAAGGLICDVKPRVPSKLVLIGAPSEMTWLFKGFGKAVGLSSKAQNVLEGRVQLISGRRLEEFDAAPIVAALTSSILVVHAEDDKEVSANHARRYAATGNAEMFWANGFGHRRIVSARPVLDRITAFLADRRADVAA